ncbi:helix-turn-helix domain-containing protein [Polyangium aurulentum]|uniref:helix-turn-helix domain-containing protein n=1 Tax=Polyangium aurulentum TaxID=2567896 RepID=UPI0010AEBF47|nr:helix-turn-helix domain-containing protein [Polyangium aurulentum]UQA60420.1 helix-turn-helix domain-containing protein [Polyangium aurulentum]
MSGSERYAKLREFARERHYGASTVRRWIKEGMPHIGSGRSLRIKVPEAEAWLAARGARMHEPPIIESKVMQ